jgi:pimeloyl-ACP methyl ester carboxylesterase
LDSNYIISSDGARISYMACGSGPALLLVHGMGSNKSMWIDRGWTDILRKHFTVIALDIRGYGESDKSYNSNFYVIENILNDFDFVVKECGFNEYSYFGHSYGATLGLQACKYKKKIRKIVCAGTTFGDKFFKITIPEWISDYEEFNSKKKNNSLSELNFSDDDIEWVKNTDLDLNISQFKAWSKWAGVEVEDIDTELAIYSGSKDNPLALDSLQINETKMKQKHIDYKVFENLNHVELVSNVDIVSPWVLDFLLK